MYINPSSFKEQGITLVELLIVIGVMTILISGFVVLINPIQKIGQANDSKRKSDIAQLQRALELYYQDNGRFPASSASYTITGVNWGDTWQPYINRLPREPSAVKNYVYYTPNIGSCINYQCYYVYANLDRGGSDPQACFPGANNPCTNAVTYGLSNRCGGVCNYGVSSPNTVP